MDSPFFRTHQIKVEGGAHGDHRGIVTEAGDGAMISTRQSRVGNEPTGQGWPRRFPI